MGTDRHHEEHEAWCVLRRQKKNGTNELLEMTIGALSFVTSGGEEYVYSNISGLPLLS